MLDGRIIGGDIYGSHALFVALWPKLLRSAATESLLALHSENTPIEPVSIDDILNYLDASGHGKMAQQHVNERTTIEVTESEHAYKFVTRDSKYSANIHTALIPH